ncbi:MAG: alanine:cation symporter family protein [Succinivibrio sp.]|nr:alanine:cation symporter family protein [Succinivibrio sp.]
MELSSIQQIVGTINDVLWTYVLIAVLIGMGLWFTIRTGVLQLRMLSEMVKVITRKATTDKRGRESISAFQAFCVSTASRVGVGNIAGVGIAIVVGGPGSIFWMWLIAFIGCATGFVESTLAQIYKMPKGHGKFHGGPAYFIDNRLGNRKLAMLFAVLISVTFGLIYNSVQSNTITLSLSHAFGLGNLEVAVILALLTGILISGGLKRIARYASLITPLMASLYILAAIAVMLIHHDQVPGMFALIFHDAFEPQAAVGGGLATVIITGIRRGLFSNEAGEGSVPNAAATATVDHPVEQGLVQAMGVYVDTWIICSATAFMILLTGQYEIGSDLKGIALVQQSLAVDFGDLSPKLLCVLVFLFAFSSILGNYYYGEVNIVYFKKHSRRNLNMYRCCVVAMVFFGCMAELSLVWDLADLFMALLCLTNLYAIARLGKYAFIALNDYTRQKKEGIRRPKFEASVMPDTLGMYTWGVEDRSMQNKKKA